MPIRPVRLVLLCLPLSACMAGPNPSAVASLPAGANADTRQLATVADQLATGTPTATVARPTVSPLIGRGYSQIAGQPGHTKNEKRLMAIRAARMEALRDLTEQIHGIRLEGQTSVRDAVVVNDALAGQVSGVLRGARTRSVQPLGDDGYQVELEVDPDTVALIVRMARGW